MENEVKLIYFWICVAMEHSRALDLQVVSVTRKSKTHGADTTRTNPKNGQLFDTQLEPQGEQTTEIGLLQKAWSKMD